MRVTAAEILVPEILSPEDTPQGNFLPRFRRAGESLLRMSQELSKSISYYIPKVNSRDEAWKTIQVIERQIFEIEDHLRGLRRIEELWEEEEFQIEDRRKNVRRR